MDESLFNANFHVSELTLLFYMQCDLEVSLKTLGNTWGMDPHFLLSII